MTKKEDFIKIYNKYITREGAKDLLTYLETTDFFTAPASTKYHLAKEGGLVEHSINAFFRFAQEVKNEYGADFEKYISPESVAICGLLHDICKAQTYTLDYRNIKEYRENGSKRDEKGRFDWVSKQVYTVNEEFPFGHGEKSIFLITKFMKLSDEEAMIINWHMGPYDLRVKGGSYSLPEAYKKYLNVLLFYVADLKSAYIDEREKSPDNEKF